MFLAILPLALVSTVVWVGIDAIAMSLVINERAFVSTAVWKNRDSLAMSLVILPIACEGTVLVVLGTFSISHAIPPNAIIVLGAVWVVQDALAMSFAIRELASV